MTHQELIDMFRKQKKFMNFIKFLEHLEEEGVDITHHGTELDKQE